MTKRPLMSPSLMRRTKDNVHKIQKRINRTLFRGPGPGMRTDVVAHGKAVIFVHNPRTGGRSLENLLGVKRLSHSYPFEKLDERHWLDSFVVTSIRHPLDRFFSGYFGACKTDWEGSLVKRYGLGIHDLNPVEYLHLIKNHPRYAGPQTNWTDFPSLRKPRADLVLRLEDVSDWEDQMRGAGLELGGRSLRHIGKSKNAASRNPKDLALSENEYSKLIHDVEAYYAADYETFGYERGTRI